jgi:hypothetical protein
VPDQSAGDYVGKNEPSNINTEKKLVDGEQPPDDKEKEDEVHIFLDIKFVEHYSTLSQFLVS